MSKDEGEANKAHILLGVCYRPHKQDEEVDEVFYKMLAEVSQSLGRGTLNYQISVGNTTQQTGNSLGGSWSVQKITS